MTINCFLGNCHNAGNYDYVIGFALFGENKFFISSKPIISHNGYQSFIEIFLFFSYYYFCNATHPVKTGAIENQVSAPPPTSTSNDVYEQVRRDCAGACAACAGYAPCRPCWAALARGARPTRSRPCPPPGCTPCTCRPATHAHARTSTYVYSAVNH